MKFITPKLASILGYQRTRNLKDEELPPSMLKAKKEEIEKSKKIFKKRNWRNT
jgi:hypothetical protein